MYVDYADGLSEKKDTANMYAWSFLKHYSSQKWHPDHNA